jgi:phage-related protein
MRLHEKLMACENVLQEQQESTADYVIRLKRTVEELATRGHKVDPLTHKLKLLRVHPMRGTGQDVLDMFVSNLRELIEDLHVEKIKEKLIVHQQSLLEQQRATRNANAITVAAVNARQNPPWGGPTGQPRSLDPSVITALQGYNPTAAWIPRDTTQKKECAIHKQLGMSCKHNTRDCWLKGHPQAAHVVKSIEDRMSAFNQQNFNL